YGAKKAIATLEQFSRDLHGGKAHPVLRPGKDRGEESLVRRFLSPQETDLAYRHHRRTLADQCLAAARRVEDGRQRAAPEYRPFWLIGFLAVLSSPHS